MFTATNLTPGYHVFSVLGTDAQGNLRTSNPALVVVQSPQRMALRVQALHEA
jgi:hypothetical protein